MPGHHLHAAAARRDEGVAKVRRITWRAGAAGVICSAVIAVAFGHHAEAGTPPPATPPGTIAVPSQPPAPPPGDAAGAPRGGPTRRFRGDSELTALNQARGAQRPVSVVFAELIAASL